MVRSFVWCNAFVVLATISVAFTSYAVFRWKLLAGVASLAAVMAVSWTVLGTTPGSAVYGFDAGHWMMVERPAEFTRVVRTWLDQRTPAP